MVWTLHSFCHLRSHRRCTGRVTFDKYEVKPSGPRECSLLARHLGQGVLGSPRGEGRCRGPFPTVPKGRVDDQTIFQGKCYRGRAPVTTLPDSVARRG